MELLTPLLELLQWAAKKGLISAVEAVGIMFFVYIHFTTNRSFRAALKSVETANTKLVESQKEQIESSRQDTITCEARYAQMRVDMNLMQSQMNDLTKDMLGSVLRQQEG